MTTIYLNDSNKIDKMYDYLWFYTNKIIYTNVECFYTEYIHKISVKLLLMIADNELSILNDNYILKCNTVISSDDYNSSVCTYTINSISNDETMCKIVLFHTFTSYGENTVVFVG